MKVTYIYHSGFLVETAECYYLFDYYKGKLPQLAPGKPVIVFASHDHHDHYNPDIFCILHGQDSAAMSEGATSAVGDVNESRTITAVLAMDIPSERYPQGIPCTKVSAHETYRLPHNTTLCTLHSTDEGVAFLIRCPEGIIYHAGDLNDWVWEEESQQYNKQMTENYRHEIDLLQNMLGTCPVDIAFIPLDPRQEQDYANGMLYFLQKVPAKTVYPMHYWEQPDIIVKFREAYPQYGNITATETFL